MAECLPVEVLNEFLVLFMCVAFALPFKLFFSPPVSFLTFSLLILTLILLVGE